MKAMRNLKSIGATLVLGGGLVVSALGQAEENTPVKIKDEVFVKGPKVYLSDLVEVREPELMERLATIEVSGAALPGASKQLTASLVEARLEHAGVDLGELDPDRPAQITTTTMSMELSPEALAASLREHIELEMPWDPELTEIDVPLPRQSLKTPEGEMIIAWRASPQYRYVGPTNFRGSVLIDGTLYRNVVLRASVETYQEIVVAATDIPRGRPVSASQLTMQTVALSLAPDGAVTDMTELEGLVARKTLLPGQPVTTRVVELRRLIKRNQMVPVELKSSAIKIQHQAKAMMDGREGDVIVCANPVTKEEFQGVVRADGVVEVR
jgi:flagella basal body P-ring formation protein FlgA